MPIDIVFCFEVSKKMTGYAGFSVCKCASRNRSI